MAEADPPPRGLFASVAGMFDTLLATLQNRLELFVVEFQEEKHRLVEVLLWTAIAIFSSVVAVLMVTLSVVVLARILYGPNAMLCVIAGFALLYVATAWAACRQLKQRLSNRPLPFAETIAELKKDRECLRPKN